MPQLDGFIIIYQIYFMFFFFLGYFIFLKTTLPVVSTEMKLRRKRVLKGLLWFKNNLECLSLPKLHLEKIAAKIQGLLEHGELVATKKSFFFGLYQPDVLFLKRRIK